MCGGKRNEPLSGYAFGSPHQLKEASVNDASATPPTIGTREETTQGVGVCMEYNGLKRVKQAQIINWHSN